MRGYNKLIQGTCLNVLPDNYQPFFRNMIVHSTMSSPIGTNYTSGVFGCKNNDPFTANPGTELIPVRYTFPNGSLFSARYTYGVTTDTVNLINGDGSPVFCKSSDLQPWRQRKVYDLTPYITFAQGPAIQNAHMFSSLERKNANENFYTDRQNYSFVNASTPINGPTCKLDDWLIYSHSNDNSAGFIYSNAPEPFLDNYLENTGLTAPTTAQYGGQDIMLFCYPLNMYDTQGQYLGQYIGYYNVYIFSRATMAFPMTGYLPADPNSSLPVPPKVIPTYTFYSIQVNTYMAASGPNLSSPLLNKRRWWVYSQEGTGSTTSIFDPYFCMYLGPMFTNYQFGVNFNIENAPPETLSFNLSNMNIMVGSS